MSILNIFKLTLMKLMRNLVYNFQGFRPNQKKFSSESKNKCGYLHRYIIYIHDSITLFITLQYRLMYFVKK